MKPLVLKFGGASVATPEHFFQVADLIISKKKEYPHIVVVVSAMKGKTDELIDLAKTIHPNPPQREYDMLISTGERVSMSLLAMALAARQCEALSLTGSQSGIITCQNHSEARILDVRPERILLHLRQGRVVIVAGFQGVSLNKEITTLGRGGSDTTAVALAVALKSPRVEFYKDVPGIFSSDPKTSANPQLYTHINYAKALEIVMRGAKILHSRALLLAEKNELPLVVRSFLVEQQALPGTYITGDKRKRNRKPQYEVPLEAHFLGESEQWRLDQKIAEIQKNSLLLQKRFPEVYEAGFASEMQLFLSECTPFFKSKRSAHLLSRIAAVQYYFRKKLELVGRKATTKRSLHLKIYRESKDHAGGRENILGLLVAFNFRRDQENFGEKNFINAVRDLLPSVKPIENSFFVRKPIEEEICLAYLEVTKENQERFLSSELRKLKKELPGKLKNRIEQRLNTIFMPRNEEEVMRTILSLANQIKYLRDAPQISIVFHEQTQSHLYFTVVLVRLLKGETIALGDLFRLKSSAVQYLHEKTKIVGYLRKKYPKEASVFRLKISKEAFLRTDYSLDLYKARHVIIQELASILGDVRDFNGGIIAKQSERLMQVRELLKSEGEFDDLLLENFFYSMVPMIAGALLDPGVFKALFLMLLDSIKEYKGEGSSLKVEEKKGGLFAIAIVGEISAKEALQQAVATLPFSADELVFASTKIDRCYAIGLICTVCDSERKRQIEALLRSSILTFLPHSRYE